MQDIMFDLPSRTDVQKAVINKAAVTGKGKPELVLRDKEAS